MATIKKLSKNKEFAYKTVIFIQNSLIVEAIYEKLMKTPIILITIKELLSVSSDFQQKWKEALILKRILIFDFAKASQISTLAFEQNSGISEDENLHLNNLFFAKESIVEFLSDSKASAFMNMILP